MPQVQPNRAQTLNGLLSRVETQHGPPERLEDGTLRYPGGTTVQNRGDYYYVGVPNRYTGENGQQYQWGARIHTFDRNGNERADSPGRQ